MRHGGKTKQRTQNRGNVVEGKYDFNEEWDRSGETLTLL